MVLNSSSSVHHLEVVVGQPYAHPLTRIPGSCDYTPRLVTLRINRWPTPPVRGTLWTYLIAHLSEQEAPLRTSSQYGLVHIKWTTAARSWRPLLKGYRVLNHRLVHEARLGANHANRTGGSNESWSGSESARRALSTSNEATRYSTGSHGLRGPTKLEFRHSERARALLALSLRHVLRLAKHEPAQANMAVSPVSGHHDTVQFRDGLQSHHLSLACPRTRSVMWTPPPAMAWHSYGSSRSLHPL
jgi:hypothetical protein